MSTIKLKELSKIGYTNDQARSLALNITGKHYKHQTRDEVLQLLKDIRDKPEDYIHDPVTGKIAATFMDTEVECNYQTYSLLEETGALKIYGGKEIEASAKRQMETAMSLPITLQGALMPDAHMGYGLPVGGVLATRNAVIPFAVGVDIGCRMALSIVDESDSFFRSNGHQMKLALREHTHFGMESNPDFRREHEVMDSADFKSTELLRRLQGKAAKQLGSSGSGNHFVEFCSLELFDGNYLGLPAKKYVALLSHSGSRGLGANIAQHYTKIAMDTCKLPREAQQLAWLDMSTEAGQEYWLSMNLAGRYAKACHETIHEALLGSLGLTALAVVENHHNFAWAETMADGTAAIVHRKGATPAHKGEPGIIPGNMIDAAYLVTGTGNSQSLNSAAHGAGRAMSRQKAKDNMTVSGLKQMLSGAGVQLIGGSVEENPYAYKNIEQVMAAQTELVKVEGILHPKIVRMNKE